MTTDNFSKFMADTEQQIHKKRINAEQTNKTTIKKIKTTTNKKKQQKQTNTLYHFKPDSLIKN